MSKPLVVSADRSLTFTYDWDDLRPDGRRKEFVAADLSQVATNLEMRKVPANARVRVFEHHGAIIQITVNWDPEG